MKIIRFKGLVEAEEEWRQFEETGVCHVFQKFDWITTWYESIGVSEGYIPELFSVRDDRGAPIWFLPLARKRQWGLRILTWSGGSLADFQGPIIGDAGRNISVEEFTKIWRIIKEQVGAHDLIFFRNQPEKIGENMNPFLTLGATSTGKHYWAGFDTGRNYYEESVSKRIRQDTRRQKKRIANFGSIKFEVLETQQQRRRIVDWLIAQKSVQYRRTRAHNIFQHKGYSKFFHAIAIPDNNKHYICIAGLYVNEELVAAHLGARWQGRFYYLMPGYERKWEKYSPGKILLSQLVQAAQSDELDVFDFTIGSEGYKKEWSNHESAIFEYLSSQTFVGRIALALRYAKKKYWGLRNRKIGIVS
jgi:CelD/BcsL family acetyltransferase involved in cellulose biosynthesis